MKTNVIVIIATSLGRSKLLFDRSLRSVYLQEKVKPLQIFIVDDNEDPVEFERIKMDAKNLREEILGDRFELSKDEIPSHLFPTTIVRNKRTKGNSGTGAWNTGAELSLKYAIPGEKTFLAILDDDDCWLPDYLSSCIKVVLTHNEKHPQSEVIAVVAGLKRIEPKRSVEMLIKSTELCKRSFFIGNPGWQGSNTFVELNAFGECGAFDERMPSTNDRDLAIRLLEYCESTKKCILTLPKPLVEHYAHEGDRVTTNQIRKKIGLDIFYSKHMAKMSKEEKERSLNRAKKLFNYIPAG